MSLAMGNKLFIEKGVSVAVRYNIYIYIYIYIYKQEKQVHAAY